MSGTGKRHKYRGKLMALFRNFEREMKPAEAIRGRRHDRTARRFSGTKKVTMEQREMEENPRVCRRPAGHSSTRVLQTGKRCSPSLSGKGPVEVKHIKIQAYCPFSYLSLLSLAWLPNPLEGTPCAAVPRSYCPKNNIVRNREQKCNSDVGRNIFNICGLKSAEW